jgi:hypothetical protein
VAWRNDEEKREINASNRGVIGVNKRLNENGVLKAAYQ